MATPASTYWSRPNRGLGALAQLPASAAELQARLLARLGEFAATRAQLAEMVARAKTARELAEVQNLQADQAQLQSELPDVQAAVAAMQRGELNLALGGQVVAFVVRLEDYMNRFASARARMGLGPAPIPWGKVMAVGGAAVLGVAVMRSWARR